MIAAGNIVITLGARRSEVTRVGGYLYERGHVCALCHIDESFPLPLAAPYMKAQEVSRELSRGERAFPGLLPRGIKSPRGTCPMLIPGGEAVTA